MSKKKLMALLLTGVMAASTVSVPVFAEEAEFMVLCLFFISTYNV